MIESHIEIVATSDGRRRQWVVSWRPYGVPLTDRPECALYGNRKALVDDMPRILDAVREPDSHFPPVDITRMPPDETITIGTPQRRRTTD